MSLALLDFRRQVAEAYEQFRHSNDPTAAIQNFRSFRNNLFKFHPQSALDSAQQQQFRGLEYFPYDPDFRIQADIKPSPDPLVLSLTLGEGTATLERIGTAAVELPTGKGVLDVFWIAGYGGGIFLPFGDATNRISTYGGGRYLLDTIKGADLGSVGARLVLDFNMAYNPSCAYNPRWVCPLAPPGNRLAFAVPVGEKHPIPELAV